MTVDEIRRDEEPTALDRSSYYLDDVGRPRAAGQPRLRRGIAKVEMHPHKVRVARRDLGLSKIAQRPPQPVTKCEGEYWTTVAHALQAVPQRCWSSYK